MSIYIKLNIMNEPPVVQVRNNGNGTKIATIPAKSTICVGEQIVILRVEEYFEIRKSGSGKR